MISSRPGPRRPAAYQAMPPRGARRRRSGGGPGVDAGRASGRSLAEAGRRPADAAGAGRVVRPRVPRPPGRWRARHGRPLPLGPRPGRAGDRRLRPGALGRAAPASGRRPGGPARAVRGAPSRERGAVGSHDGDRPRADRGPQRARSGEPRSDVPDARRPRPRPSRPGPGRARGRPREPKLAATRGVALQQLAHGDPRSRPFGLITEDVGVGTEATELGHRGDEGVVLHPGVACRPRALSGRRGRGGRRSNAADQPIDPSVRSAFSERTRGHSSSPTGCRSCSA